MLVTFQKGSRSIESLRNSFQLPARQQDNCVSFALRRTRHENGPALYFVSSPDLPRRCCRWQRQDRTGFNGWRWARFACSCRRQRTPRQPQIRRPLSALCKSSLPAPAALAGRLTDLHSTPLAGFSVVLRDQATGTTVHAITTKNGAFHFASLQVGNYTLEAVSARFGRGQLEGIRITGGAESRLQVALRLEPAALAETDTAAAAQMSVAAHDAVTLPAAPTATAAATSLTRLAAKK